MMKNKLTLVIFGLIFIFPLSLLFSQNSSSIQHPASSIQTWVLVIHGGAGGTMGQKMPEDVQQEYITKMTEVLKAGAEILSKGGTFMDAVESCIRMMEDSPLFNAG
jgi:beta-aspartyl-peptidase (threonine type)